MSLVWLRYKISLICSTFTHKDKKNVKFLFFGVIGREVYEKDMVNLKRDHIQIYGIQLGFSIPQEYILINLLWTGKNI